MFQSLSLKTRLSVVFIPALVIGVLCTLFVAWQGYEGIRSLRGTSEALEKRGIARVSELGRARTYLMKASISLRDIALSSSEEQRTKIVADRATSLTKFVGLLKELEKTPTEGQEAMFATVNAHIGEISASIADFDKEWKGKYAGPIPQQATAKLADIIWNVAVPIRGKIEDNVKELSALELKHQEKLAKQASDVYLATKGEIIFAAIFAGLLGLVSTIVAMVVLSGVTSRLTFISKALGRGSDSVKSTALNVTSSSSQLAASTTQEASSIAETAAAMEEMTATIAKTVQNVATALEVADDGQQEASKGRDVVSKMIVAMNEIQNSNAKLDKMVKLIEEIKDKTRVINDIVFETRLLSFNASIEAARAGSMGRGFAVVAEEVGNLAVVSGKAADEIRVLLESTTSEVNEIVRGTQERINQGRTRAEECEQAFGTMGDTLARVGQYVKGISAAAHEQETGVKQINRAMAQLDTVTQSNASGAEDLSIQADALSQDSLKMETSVSQLVKCVLGNQGDFEDNSASYSKRAHRSQNKVTQHDADDYESNATPFRREQNKSKNGFAKNKGQHGAGANTSKTGSKVSASAKDQDSFDTIDRDDNRWKESA